jgi:hypothetical protein
MEERIDFSGRTKEWMKVKREIGLDSVRTYIIPIAERAAF